MKLWRRFLRWLARRGRLELWVTDAIYNASIVFLSVFAGLTVLWSVMRTLTLTQRLSHAAFAAAVSAVVTFLLMMIANGDVRGAMEVR